MNFFIDGVATAQRRCRMTPMSTITITTANGPATLTFDVDPYDGEATLTADLLDGNAGVAHFGFDHQAAEEAIAATLAQVERLIRANLAVAPWVEV